MGIRALKYATIWLAVALGVISILADNGFAYSLAALAFVLVPFTELFLSADSSNMSKTEMELARNDKVYDLLVYLILPIQYGLLLTFLFDVSTNEYPTWVLAGKIWALGITCGVLGINVGHELGHRITWYEKLMAKALLLTSLYMHFFIEHNRGHHLNVSTPGDPNSARRGEPLYFFWFRSIITGYFSAWKIENHRLRKAGKPVISLNNEMLVYQFIQAAFLGGIAWAFGWKVMLWYLIAATIGFFLLETVNYIEHYGLQRKKMPNGRFERVRPDHSWNSDHPLGRLLLFELSRHSDHHYRPGRKYQLLRHMEKSPQMPTGYPGMMVLAFLPPIWFKVMHLQIDKFRAANPIQGNS